jgi:hypothetical protein
LRQRQQIQTLLRIGVRRGAVAQHTATTLLEVPYVGLIEDQQGWTRRMLDFIGVPWDPKCLDFHRTDRVVISFSKTNGQGSGG